MCVQWTGSNVCASCDSQQVRGRFNLQIEQLSPADLEPHSLHTPCSAVISPNLGRPDDLR